MEHIVSMILSPMRQELRTISMTKSLVASLVLCEEIDVEMLLPYDVSDDVLEDDTLIWRE